MSATTENRTEAATVASNFLKGNIPDNELEACLTTVQSGSSSFSAGGSFLCTFFYFRVVLTGLSACQKTFTGNAGGLGGVGGASTNGDLYLADGVTCEELTSTTTSFQFNCAVVYLNVNFFNANSKFLGSYQGGGVGTCGGIGGGSGSWS
jgi:Rhodococcus equi virulence-associated protein